jgi:hypothetical protein
MIYQIQNYFVDAGKTSESVIKNIETQLGKDRFTPDGHQTGTPSSGDVRCVLSDIQSSFVTCCYRNDLGKSVVHATFI